MTGHDTTFRKRLDDDCLLDRQLHPSIAERLNRVRELPLADVANLHGVEVDADGVWLVWEYVDGVTLEQWLASANRSSDERARLGHELRLAVAGLHAHGIVHGALHARNVIIDIDGKLHLTHVSPLLYSDPQQDTQAVERMLEETLSRPRAAMNGASDDDRADRRMRSRVYLAAIGAILAGILIFWAILWYIRA